MEHTWIFDLDNTLHDSQKKIFPVINHKINIYISELIKIKYIEADKLRQKYWDKYGATLEGLIKHHKVNPSKFLEETHTIENFSELIVPMPGLVKTLSSLKGKKVLYTNGPKNYTNMILKECKIEHFFDGIFSIEDSKFVPKPNEISMELFLDKYQISKAYFVDDIKENLETAKKFGLSTIWITDEVGHPSYIDKKICQLSELIKN